MEGYQAGLDLTDTLLASASQTLGLKACAKNTLKMNIYKIKLIVMIGDGMTTKTQLMQCLRQHVQSSVHTSTPPTQLQPQSFTLQIQTQCNCYVNSCYTVFLKRG